MPIAPSLPYGVPRTRFLDELEADELLEARRKASYAETPADSKLLEPELSLSSAAALLSNRGINLEVLLDSARRLTDEVFGRRILIYAPCYLSSFCINHCRYCGFNFSMETPRRLLTTGEARQEMQLLESRGMRRILLVAGDYPAKVTPRYIEEMVKVAGALVPEVDLEVAPPSTAIYRRWVQAGAGGVTCYQETYDPAQYSILHPRGPKRIFEFRLGAPERAGLAGMKRLGIGILLGLADPVSDLLSLIAHGRYLQRLFPDVRLTVSLPRLRPAVPSFRPPFVVDDEALLRFYAVLRLALPRAGLVVSTREAGALRERLLETGITQMSAGSVTVPGGYAEPLEEEDGQFEVADHRSVTEVVTDLRSRGYDPRWTTS